VYDARWFTLLNADILLYGGDQFCASKISEKEAIAVAEVGQCGILQA
jgi:hypothetical protein